MRIVESPDIALNYIDKLVSSLERVEDSYSRLLRLQIIVSSLLLLLVTGIVSAQEDIEISCIALTLPLWILIGGGAIAAGTLQTIVALQFYHNTRLSVEILVRYRELDFETPAENAKRGLDLYSSPIDVMTNIWGAEDPRLLVFPALVISLMIVVLLPGAAQLAAIVKLGGDFGWTWKAWLPLGVMLILSAAITFWALVQLRISIRRTDP
jgi:hypothetical protein